MNGVAFGLDQLNCLVDERHGFNELTTCRQALHSSEMLNSVRISPWRAVRIFCRQSRRLLTPPFASPWRMASCALYANTQGSGSLRSAMLLCACMLADRADDTVFDCRHFHQRRSRQSGNEELSMFPAVPQSARHAPEEESTLVLVVFSRLADRCDGSVKRVRYRFHARRRSCGGTRPIGLSD